VRGGLRYDWVGASCHPEGSEGSLTTFGMTRDSRALEVWAMSPLREAKKGTPSGTPPFASLDRARDKLCILNSELSCSVESELPVRRLRETVSRVHHVAARVFVRPQPLGHFAVGFLHGTV